jgi:hypothetical protein
VSAPTTPSSSSSPATPPPCPHGLRPGTTVCLHCRQEARAAAQQRRYRLAARVGLATLGGAVLISLIIGGLNAIAPDARELGKAVAQSVRRSANQVATAAVQRSRTPSLEPVIAEGRRELGDSVFAERVDDQVTVHFDTDALRTRYDWKFEGVVRATLPAVFGPDARAALDSVPSGTFVRGGDLLRELPTRGIPLELKGSGQTLKVWPITRAGRDGPLVVGYRVSPAR